MATIKLWTDEEVAADARVKAVFDDIRSIRESEFVNNFWRALANQPALLERTWASIKEVMIEPVFCRAADYPELVSSGPSLHIH
jgi:alkylhydroperoxidase family enzyme